MTAPLNCFWRFMLALGIVYNVEGDPLTKFKKNTVEYSAFKKAWKGKTRSSSRLLKRPDAIYTSMENRYDVQDNSPLWRGTTYATGEPKPVFRGVLHLFAAIVLMPVVIYLGSRVWHSPVSMAMVLLVDLIVALTLLVSGLYHRVPWPTDLSSNFFRRWDHCNIFLCSGAAISAQSIYLIQQDSSVSVALGITILTIEWLIVAFGVGYSCGAPLVHAIDNYRVFLYTLSGIIPFVFIGVFYYIELTLEFSVQIVMLFLSGLCIIIFQRRILDFAPDIFGSHEIFHVLVLVGTTITCWLAFSLAGRV